MRITTGSALISHAVVRSYGIELVSARDNFPMFYVSGLDFFAAANPLTHFQDRRSTYLYENCSGFDDSFSYKHFPAMSVVRTWVYHPQENRIMDEIIGLNHSLRKVEMPVVVGGRGTEQRIAELDGWHKKFSEKYSEILKLG